MREFVQHDTLRWAAAEQERVFAERQQRVAVAMLLVYVGIWSTDCLYEILRGELRAVPIFLAGLGATGLAYLFVRRAQTQVAGLILVATIDGGYLLPFFLVVHHLDVTDLPTFFLLATSVLVAAFLLPATAVFWVVGGNSVLSIVTVLVLPHTTALSAMLHAGDAVRTLEQAMGLHVLIAVVAYAWVRNTQRALAERDQATTIAHLQQRELAEKEALELGIAHLLATQVRAANGDMRVRAELPEQNVLWRVANSLNMLLARLQRCRQTEQLAQQMAAQSTQLVSAIQRLKQGERPHWPPPEGTPLDALIQELSAP
jgi:hypothetical protein